MTGRKMRCFVFGLVFLAVFAGFTICLKTVDVRTIGPSFTKVGFASLNGFARVFFGASEKMFYVSEFLGYLALAVCLCFFCIGVYQMISGEKGLKSVSRGIWATGSLYVVLLFLFVLFNKVIIINFRPVAEGSGYPEVSYPSSHTMLAICVFLSASDQIACLAENKGLGSVLSVICWILAFATVISRLLSGVHWFTDIIGAVLLSSGLICFYLLFAGSEP